MKFIKTVAKKQKKKQKLKSAKTHNTSRGTAGCQNIVTDVLRMFFFFFFYSQDVNISLVYSTFVISFFTVSSFSVRFIDF